MEVFCPHPALSLQCVSVSSPFSKPSSLTFCLLLHRSLRPHIDGPHFWFSLGGLICRHDHNRRSWDYHDDEVESVRDVDCSALAIGIVNDGLYIGQKGASLSPSRDNSSLPAFLPARLSRSIRDTAIDKVCSHEHL